VSTQVDRDAPPSAALRHDVMARPYGIEILPQHAAKLAASGVSREVAAARGYRSIDTKAGLKREGFAPAQCRAPALLVPIHDVTGTVRTLQARPDAPRLRNEKPVKYETRAGDRLCLDVPPSVRTALGDPSQELWITEGPLKVDAGASHGLCIVGVCGVYGFRGRNEHGGLTALSDWEFVALNGRVVYLCFDSDVTTKPNVQAALKRLSRFLESRNARVRIVRLPHGPEKVGLDDYLAAGQSVEELRTLATDTEPAARAAAVADSGLHFTDLGASVLFVARYSAQVRYAHDLRRWLVWTGTHWQADADGAAMRLAQDLVRGLYAQAATLADDRRRALADFALKLESEARLSAALELAKAHRAVAVTSGVFDQTTGTIVCRNGTVNLRTGDLGPHRPEDFSTFCLPLDYDPHATSALWQQTLDLALPSDRQTFLQRLMGWAATGQRDEDLLPIFSGPGGAAKTTITQAILAAFGPYGATASFESFLARKHVTGGPREDLAALRGKRLVLAGEVQPGRELDAALLKQLTGGDVIRARALYREGIEFRPRFVLALVCNEPPRADATDDALFRRVCFVPFDRPIPKAQQHPAVKRLLRDTPNVQQAVLQWIVSGARDYYRSGLQPPDSVLQATQAYHFETNPAWPFVRDRCVLQKGQETLVSELRVAYEVWCGSEHEKPLSGKAFNNNLEALGCTRTRSGKDRQKAWWGIALASHDARADQTDRVEPVLDRVSHEGSRGKFVGNAPVSVLSVRPMVHGVSLAVWNSLPQIARQAAALFNADVTPEDVPDEG
jgi:putative DNA primase/helicase